MIREASETQMVKAEVMDQEAFVCVMDDYHGNLELRGKMYEESKQPQQFDDEDEDLILNMLGKAKEEEGGQKVA